MDIVWERDRDGDAYSVVGVVKVAGNVGVVELMGQIVV